MRPHALMVLAVGLLLAADAPKPKQDPAKAERQNLQGTWQVISIAANGRQATKEEMKDFKWVITADKITWTDNKKSEFLYKLNPTRKPKQIDLTFPEKKDKPDETIQGIYSLEGDTLKVCYGKTSRPTDLTAKKGVRQALFVLKREKR